MAGYEDTRQKIISTLMGRPNETEIQPENHQDYALNMLDYIRGLELIATSTLIGVAESNTTPVQPNSSRVCYIAGVAQNQTVVFENFIDENGNPISVTTGDMEGVFIILLWNTQYWSAQTFSTNIISHSESATFYYRYNIRKTYASIALMNADVVSPIGTDGKYIKVGDIVTVVNSTTPSENGIYSYEGATDGWKYQSSFNFQLSQTIGTDPNVAMSQKTVTENLMSKNIISFSSSSFYAVKIIKDIKVWVRDNLEHTFALSVIGFYPEHNNSVLIELYDLTSGGYIDNTNHLIPFPTGSSSTPTGIKRYKYCNSKFGFDITIDWSKYTTNYGSITSDIILNVFPLYDNNSLISFGNNKFWSFNPTGYVEINKLDSTFTIKNIRVASTKTGAFLEGTYIINTDNSKINQYIIADVSTGVLNISLGTKDYYWLEDFNDSKMLFAYQNDGFWNSPISIVQQQLPFLDNKNINWCVSSDSVAFDGDNITFKSPIYLAKKSGTFSDVSQTYTFNCSGQFDYIIISGVTLGSGANMTMRKGTQSFWWQDIDNLSIDETILCFKTHGKWNSLYSNIAIALHEALKHTTNTDELKYSPKSSDSIVFSSDFNTLTLKDIDAQKGSTNYGTSDTTSFDVSPTFCYIKMTGFEGGGQTLVPILGTATNGYYWLDNVLSTEDIFAYKYFGKWYSTSPQIQMLLDKAIAKVNLDNSAKTLVSKQNMLSYTESENLDNNFYPNCYFVGKWFAKTINSKPCTCTINQGAEFCFMVENTTTVALNLINISPTDHNPWVSVSIDGGAYTRYMEGIGENTVQIASDLSLTKHYIRVVVDGLDEHDAKWLSGIGFVLNSVSVDNGGTVKAVKPRNRKIEFLGDSITEGINVRGTGATATNNSGQLSYPYIACRNLNAISLRDGFGASGVTHGGSGGAPAAIDTIDWAMSGVPLIMDEPDFIVINHGQNDGAADAATFQAAYDALIKALQAKYPGKLIFCMIPFSQQHAANITLIANNNNCVLVPTVGWGVTYTDGTHPDIAGGETAGTKLAQFIVDKLGISYFIS